MTVMTVTTVGYGEVLPGFETTPYARMFAAVLMVVGVGQVLYAATLIAAIVFEGELKQALGIRRMTKTLDKIRQHYVVCGCGSMGFHIVEELVLRGESVVVVEADDARLGRLAEAFPQVPWVKGDATDDEVLTRAGADRANGVFAALSQDKDNLFVVISVRQFNPKARIIARAIEPKTVQKLRIAGADATVSPNFLGGRRMASEMLKPSVVAFMDVIADRDREFDIEEVQIGPESAFVGQTLAEAQLRKKADVLVLAICESGTYRYNPPDDAKLPSRGRLLVLANAAAVEKLRTLLQ